MDNFLKKPCAHENLKLNLLITVKTQSWKCWNLSSSNLVLINRPLTLPHVLQLYKFGFGGCFWPTLCSCLAMLSNDRDSRKFLAPTNSRPLSSSNSRALKQQERSSSNRRTPWNCCNSENVDLQGGPQSNTDMSRWFPHNLKIKILSMGEPAYAFVLVCRCQCVCLYLWRNVLICIQKRDNSDNFAGALVLDQSFVLYLSFLLYSEVNFFINYVLQKVSKES